MQKSLSVFLCFLFFTICYAADFMAIAEESRNYCLPKFNLTREYLDKLNNEKILPDDDNFKCYLSCGSEYVKCLTDEGAVDGQCYFNMLDDKFREVIKEALFKCEKQVGKDSCDSVYLSAKCFLKEMPEHFHIV